MDVGEQRSWHHLQDGEEAAEEPKWEFNVTNVENDFKNCCIMCLLKTTRSRFGAFNTKTVGFLLVDLL